MKLIGTIEKIKESNRIEGIHRAVKSTEIEEFHRFMDLSRVEVYDLEIFVHVYQPGAVLRALPHLNVRVGAYTPPRGGQHIVDQLKALLTDVHARKVTAYQAHIQYENLHPFTDGNGRSGRMLWYWMMRYQDGLSNLGFLHAFYYQTLHGARSV